MPLTLRTLAKIWITYPLQWPAESTEEGCVAALQKSWDSEKFTPRNLGWADWSVIRSPLASGMSSWLATFTTVDPMKHDVVCIQTPRSQSNAVLRHTHNYVVHQKIKFCHNFLPLFVQNLYDVYILWNTKSEILKNQDQCCYRQLLNMFFYNFFLLLIEKLK